MLKKSSIENFRNWIHRLVFFFKGNSAACGIVLICATALALFMSNVPVLSKWYQTLWDITFTINIGSFPELKITLMEFVNSGLMSVFFFSVGLEIKREIKYGHLSTWRQASLPVFAALGGMIFPALIYAICNVGSPELRHGWGIPMATDIAFSLGILSMFSKKVPLSLKVFLTTLAVADDLGSIIVIALFYSQEVDFFFLSIALLMAAFMFILNYFKVHTIKLYIIPSICIWVCFMLSGVHVTIAGVWIAFALPMHSRIDKSDFCREAKKLISQVNVDEPRDYVSNQTHAALQRMRFISHNTIPPLQRLEHALGEFVNFVIMPLFAFANSGVVIDFSHLSGFVSTETLGIILGLLIGKPLGICLTSMLLIKFKFAEKPDGASIGSYIGVGCLGGIGFTMSIFVDTLAFASNQEFVDVGKIAILIGSFLSAVIGALVLKSLKNIDKKYHW